MQEDLPLELQQELMKAYFGGISLALDVYLSKCVHYLPVRVIVDE